MARPSRFCGVSNLPVLVVHSLSTGTKSMQALAAQREQLKTERKQQSRAQQEAEQQRRFERKQRKKLERHKGH